MSKLVLTQNLYIFDEVGISFISSLLNHQSIDECYFWISELYHSGFHKQTWDLAWFVFYDFYFVLNPSFEVFLSKKYLANDFKSLITVVKNLFRMVHCSQVFITRQYCMNVKEITHVFKGKKPLWLANFPSKYHTLFRFIDKKMYHLAITCLPESIEEDLFLSIQTYFKATDSQICYIKERFYENKYANPLHKICAVICMFIFNPTHDYENIKQKIYIGCSDTEYDEIIQSSDQPIPLNIHNIPQIYKTLEFKRKYAIHCNCSGFNLMRDMFPDIKQVIWYQWEFYAYDCPLWNERFNKYDITLNEDKHMITFNNDDDIELFYSQFGYEPDEQNIETQNKGLLLCQNNNWKGWYNNIFTEPSIYDFKEDFKFTY